MVSLDGKIAIVTGGAQGLGEHSARRLAQCGATIVVTDREGVVYVFKLTGHPKATRAYAWSSPIEGSDKRRFFAVLDIPPIMSPVDAVRAAIVAERRTT